MCPNTLQPWSVPSPAGRSEAAADFTPRGCGRSGREGCTEERPGELDLGGGGGGIVWKRQERPFEPFSNLGMENVIPEGQRKITVGTLKNMFNCRT